MDGVQLIDQPQGLLELTGQTGALEYLARQLNIQAPADYVANAEFKAQLNAVQQSVADLKAVLLAQDAAAVKATIGKLKGAYSKMFVKFG